MIRHFMTGQTLEVSTPWTIGYVLLALAGLGLWLAGAKFSRILLTVVAAAAGAWIGMHLPDAMKLHVKPWATAAGGAVLLGITGYTLHKLWVGIALAVILAGWATAGGWLALGAGQIHELPARLETQTMMEHARAVWQTLPEKFRQIGPFFAGVALVGGLAVAILWIRIAGYLLFSLLGVGLMMIGGKVALENIRPQLLEKLPPERPIQIAILAVMVLLGALVQWRVATKKAALPKEAQG